MHNICIFMVMSLLSLLLYVSLSNLSYVSLLNAQGSLLYILPLSNNRVVKLSAIYSILHISFHNIFVEKEKYNE